MIYISKDQAIRLACEAADDWDGGGNKSRDAYIIDAIDGAEPADVQPVKHGEWEREEYSPYVKCSHCGMAFDYADGLLYLVAGSRLPNFCPNCGADMRGET